MVVCGTGADKAQFVPFEWPEHAVVWVSVGCGNLTVLAPAPSDADSDARDELARKYVEATGAVSADRREEVETDRREEVETDRREEVEAVGADRREEAVSSWLRLVERAARVPCTLLVAGGGVRVTAVPTYQVAWSARHVTVVCARFRTTERRRRATVEQVVSAVLAEHGVYAPPDLEATFRVVRYNGWMDLLPYERCSLCNGEIRSSFRDVVPFCEEMRSETVAWLPQLLVCASCPLRPFEIHGFHFEVRGGRVYPTETREGSARLFCDEESAWQPRRRVIATLALALASRAEPKTAFASALATALCDLKLLRLVAARMLPPEPKDVHPRAVSLLVERVLPLTNPPPKKKAALVQKGPRWALC